MSESDDKRSVGATLKYAALIARLKDRTLYTPAMISRLDPEVKAGFLRHNRICKSLGSFSRYHGISEEPDGHLKQYKAWYGSTWKKYVKPEDFTGAEPLSAPSKLLTRITLPLWAIALLLFLPVASFSLGWLSGGRQPDRSHSLQADGATVQDRVRAMVASYRRNRLRNNALHAPLANCKFPTYAELQTMSARSQPPLSGAHDGGAQDFPLLPLPDDRSAPTPSPP